MKIKTEVVINGTKEDVWRVITDIDGSVETIRAIESIDVLEKPDVGVVGLKWKETRTMFGQQATEVMWITDAKENEYYQTRAESHGAIYVSRFDLEEDGDKTLLTMGFEGEALGFGAKVMSFLTGFMFKGATEKALKEDLIDIKAAVEN